MGIRDEFGYLNGIDDLQGPSRVNKRDNYTIYKDAKTSEYRIVRITPIDDKISHFKKGTLIPENTSINKKPIKLFAYFSPNRKPVQEVVGADNITTNKNIGVIDNKVRVMGPEASYLFPICMPLEKKEKCLDRYINDSNNDYFTFQYKDNDGKRRYFLMYDKNGRFVEVNESLYIMHLIQSGNFSALNDIGDYDTINHILDCFEIKKFVVVGKTDGEREINKTKRFSDILAGRSK